tara:strand:+ start:858 stop:1526 length:669 start_codon:yes stop_codon:yes gene_type:complete
MEVTDALSQYSVSASEGLSTKKKDELGQDDFMRLLVTQLENQDPTKPMDNFEFLSQVAQFGMVSGIQESQESLNKMIDSLLSNRTLQAAGLVGKKVVADSNISSLAENGEISGFVDLPVAAAAVAVQVSNTAGQVMRSVQLGPSDAGRLPFVWDGLDEAGERAPPGLYRVTSSAIIAGEEEAVPAYAASLVSSVSAATGGADIKINLATGEVVSFADVREFL